MPVTADSVFARRRRLYTAVQNGELSPRVLEDVLPSGEPLLYEKQLWDYKFELPILPGGTRPTDAILAAHRLVLTEVVKDVVAFYNSYGGYLVIGVSDNPRQIQGFAGFFDCDELNKQVKAVTRHDVDCHYAILDCPAQSPQVKVGLLMIPQRPDSKEPAQFLRDAPASPTGARAFRTFDIYLRDGHECRPAKSADDYALLCSHGRRRFESAFAPSQVPAIDTNLGPREPQLTRFVGRDTDLQKLWRWLCDPFDPGRLLAGLGGVGKTTIARQFVEELIYNPPSGLERVIWLSAKQQIYSASTGEYVPATRVDFSDVATLLRALLAELGTPDSAIDSGWTSTELEQEVVAALQTIPAFIVIDDVDSLEPSEQQATLHAMLRITGRTIGVASTSSRVLLTARLDLGAAPTQLIRITGLPRDELFEFVNMTAQQIGLALNLRVENRLMRLFHEVTDGSPTFAASILRLLEHGDDLRSALERWRGSGGEEVRRFAFGKEVSNLTESQLRVLYTVCVLSDTSLLEVQQVTQSPSGLLHDDIGELRKYHMLVVGGEGPRGGARLIAPSGIRLMSDLIASKIRDPRRIERECSELRKGAAVRNPEAGRIFHVVNALWREGHADAAVDEVQIAVKRTPTSGDLRCLLGRAYLRLDVPKLHEADIAFHRGYDLGCKRPDLMRGWIETRRRREDWMGVVELTQLAERDDDSSDHLFYRSDAYFRLAEAAEASGDLRRAATYCLTSASEIDKAFSKGAAKGRVEDLRSLRSELLHRYVRLIDQLTTGPGDHLDVWIACLEAFQRYVRPAGLVRLGIDRLASWWASVEERESYDRRAGGLMRIQLERLASLMEAIRKQDVRHEPLLAYATERQAHLSLRWASYEKKGA